MYSKTNLSIKLGDKLTKTFPSTIGVRQGDNLSPTLFNLYINDLQQHLKNEENTDPVTIGTFTLNALLYADDVILLSTSSKGLQNCIRTLKEFSDTWKLEVNLDKTKTLIFNNKNQQNNEKFWYGNKEIQQTSKYTYLGIELDTTGTFTEAIKSLHAKALKALYKLQQITENNYNIKTNLYIFDHTIKPILLYGSEVWGAHLVKTKNLSNKSKIIKDLEDNIINQLELKYCRGLLKVKRNTATTGVRGELGRHPIGISALSNSMKYLKTLEQKPNDTLVKQALIEQSNPNHKQNSWYNHVKELEKTFHIQPPRINPTKAHIKSYYKVIKGTLQSEYENLWLNRLHATQSITKGKGGNKLRTYAQIKQNFTLEPYLMEVDNPLHRKALTQLRLSSHNLNIESMRHTTRDPNQRLCNLCNRNEIENEEHFLLTCPMYETYRTALIETNLTLCQNLTHLNQTEKFVWLLTNEDKTTLKALGKYIWLAQDMRKNKLKTKNNEPTGSL